MSQPAGVSRPGWTPAIACASSTHTASRRWTSSATRLTLPADRYNAANTMKINGNIYLGKGTSLYSDRAQVLMRIVEDTCGRHDTIGGCCSAWSNFARYGTQDTPGCHANFAAELACWSLGPSDIVANVNFFMNVPVRQDGGMAIEAGLSKPGDYVELLAAMPVIARAFQLSATVQSGRGLWTNADRGHRPARVAVSRYGPIILGPTPKPPALFANFCRSVRERIRSAALPQSSPPSLVRKPAQ